MSFNELKKVIENTKNIINEGMKDLHQQSEQLETINSNKIEEFTIKSNKFLNRISSITYNVYHKLFHTQNNVVNPTIDSNIDSTTDSTIDSIANPITDNISIKDEQYDYIQNSIKIIKQMSYELGEELDKQNEELDNINDSVSKNINDIKKLDKKIDKLL